MSPRIYTFCRSSECGPSPLAIPASRRLCDKGSFLGPAAGPITNSAGRGASQSVLTSPQSTTVWGQAPLVRLGGRQGSHLPSAPQSIEAQPAAEDPGQADRVGDLPGPNRALPRPRPLRSPPSSPHPRDGADGSNSRQVEGRLQPFTPAPGGEAGGCGGGGETDELPGYENPGSLGLQSGLKSPTPAEVVGTPAATPRPRQAGCELAQRRNLAIAGRRAGVAPLPPLLLALVPVAEETAPQLPPARGFLALFSSP